MTSHTPHVLVITGSMGSGKTTVMAEASDLLTTRGFAHAAIDVDALGVYTLPLAKTDDGLTYRNLRAVWENYATAGIDKLLLASALENRAEIDRVRLAVAGAEIVVCRLKAPLATMQERVRLREPGLLQQRFVDRVAPLDALLDEAALEDFPLTNDGRSVTEVALEMLQRAAWL